MCLGKQRQQLQGHPNSEHTAHLRDASPSDRLVAPGLFATIDSEVPSTSVLLS